VFLHQVVDKWFVDEARPRRRGRAQLVRCADDMVFVFEVEEDAKGVFEVLPKPFGAHRLTLQPEKTRMVKFPRPPRRPEGTSVRRERGERDLRLPGFHPLFPPDVEATASRTGGCFHPADRPGAVRDSVLTRGPSLQLGRSSRSLGACSDGLRRGSLALRATTGR